MRLLHVHRSRLALGVAGALLCSLASVGVGPAAVSAAPLLTADPSTDLEDGQLITVTASGLDATRHAIGECTGPTSNSCEIVFAQLGDASDFTSVNTVVRARTTVMLVDGTTADCRSVACTLAVVGPPASGDAPLGPTVPLGFDPTAPLQAIAGLTITPDVNIQLTAVVHVTSPAYLNPGQPMRLTVCHQGSAGSPATLRCSLISQSTTANGAGAIDTQFTYHPNPDETDFPIANDRSCVVENGCRYVAAIGESLPRAMLGTINSGDPGPTTTTTSPVATVAPITTATPTFTG